jgi:hypothetical protein
MKYLFVLLSIFFTQSFCAQYNPLSGSIFYKEFSKVHTEYIAKAYVAEQILTPTGTAQKFYVDAVTAATSGELTCLVYKADGKKGLLFGFWGKKVNENGLLINQYSFTHLEYGRALKLLESLEKILADNFQYAVSDEPEQELIIRIEDFDFLIHLDHTPVLRVIWNGFDSEWRVSELKRTKKRLLKKLK